MDNERLRYYRLQALRGNSFARKVVDAFDPDQPRDPDGKWGGGGGGKGTAAYHNQKATEHAAEAAKYISNEHHSAHMNAAAAHAVAAAGAHTTPEGSRSQQEAVQKAESLSEKANATLAQAILKATAGAEILREKATVPFTPSAERALLVEQAAAIGILADIARQHLTSNPWTPPSSKPRRV